MTTTDAATVSVSTEVHAPLARAFHVFTTEIGTWWDADKHILQSPLAEMVFEPFVAGNIIDRGTDGSECRWARVLTPLLIRVDEASRPTLVRWTVLECTFMADWVATQPTFSITALGDGACELRFEHRGLSDELECKDMCSRSWNHFIGTSLRELAEGGPGAPNRSPRDLARRAAEDNA
jgi:hypothetical protein